MLSEYSNSPNVFFFVAAVNGGLFSGDRRGAFLKCQSTILTGNKVELKTPLFINKCKKKH